MQAAGVNTVFRRLAATAGLLLILVADAAGADPLVTDAVTAAASQPQLTDVSANEVDSSVNALVDASNASKDNTSTVENPVAQVDDAGAFLGQLVTQYFESYN